jgi:hypothetical protein
MSLSISVLLISLLVAIMLLMGCISFIEVLNIQDGGYEKKDNNKKTSKNFKKLFIKKLLDMIASLGLSFFITSHFYSTPIVYCMLRHKNKVNGQVEKREMVDIKDHSIKSSWNKGFPRRRVFAT